ncbi:4-(cytidine 5'-diphospho)-2-C-methyl-D-erythritol kinase [Ramlibacter tataouinensis]|uniref:4-diphosphocytidyl-2-C-methyl-D-erythritol kinase n=1 Tax=Ramlibacter tataouinensis (strain ATCC BAA-407 / DSM 14655 / LMG 21543 / TTB310) TaxID=365046 RepID=F5XYS3_RAMTT|nr:4-(cytidine 5'-diphospho)-2-C-methyl-D-erythritol kinase [Ramlibacter tataouinensis]AEG94440.1 4-(cytidine 5-diphospho)-2-C-methyl-D-erythritol kinase (4-diphosphocytidyl-2-C-methyl-D-erythritol kinase)-like protein [Ramlibacter tataouinensis TTB310]
MKSLHDVPAPAKLNLFLHVTGRRADGYHLLQSAFMLLDWHDSLHFELRGDGRLSREDLTTPLPDDDLCLRAARALQQAGGTAQGAHIAIAKRLPAQAGLGGGSSDAATCLLALNRLWRLGLDLGQLEAIGLALGADVPFFLRGRNAWVEGIGERITPIDLPPARFVVLKPQAGLQTQQIFTDPALKRDSHPAILSGFAANPYGFGRNDLQPVAQRLCPQVGQSLDWLALQGLQPRMTGSGSAVFALLPRGHQPLQAAPAGAQLRVCGNLEVHPLVGWAPSDDSSVGG